MRAVEIGSFGGPEVLREAVVETPSPDANEIRIRVVAAGVNPADGLSRNERWVQWATETTGSPLTPPFIPGLEVAGVVEAVGTSVAAAFSVGDRVMAPLWSGGYAQYVVVPAAMAVDVPASVGFEHAATVPMGGLTALRAVDKAGVMAGGWVMVDGAAGVVGGYAAQIAKAQGMNVIADAAEKDRDWVLGLGVDYVVPRGEDCVSAIRKLRPGGVDAVIDTALLGPAIAGALRPRGVLATLRQPGEPGTTPVPRDANIEVRGVTAVDYYRLRQKLLYLCDLVDSGRLTTRVAASFGFAEAAAAHRLLDGSGVRGRIVLTPADLN